MSSSTNNLPPYQEKPSSTRETRAPITRLANIVQTCSIRDAQVDYFSITRVSDSTYHLSLSVDPTPLYRIELVPGPSKVGNIQIFSASPSDSALPAIAAARTSTDGKSKTLRGTVCTDSPTEPDATWRPIALQKGFLPLWFDTNIPVVTVPGRAAKPQSFVWKTVSGKYSRLYWEGPLFNHVNPTSNDLTFVKLSLEPHDEEELLVEMRRGAGIDFELSVILEVFLLLDLDLKVKSA